MAALRKGYAAEAEADLQLNATKSEQDCWQEQLSILQAPDADTEAAAEKFVVQSKQLHRWWCLFLASEQQRQMRNTLLRKCVPYGAGETELRFSLLVSAEQITDTIAALPSNNVLYIIIGETKFAVIVRCWHSTHRQREDNRAKDGDNPSH